MVFPHGKDLFNVLHMTIVIALKALVLFSALVQFVSTHQILFTHWKCYK